MRLAAGSELTHYARHARLLHWQVAYWRILAGLLIVLGLFRWALAIGALPSVSGNFEGLSVAWQWATINLGVTYLVAGVGLWLLASWGPVVWFYGAASEIAMHTLFSGTFETRLYPVLLQLVLIGGFLWLRWAIRNASINRFRSRSEMRQASGGDFAISIGRITEGAREGFGQILVLTRLTGKEKKRTTEIEAE